VIIGREIAISALREWMAEIGERTKVAVSSLGKYKTILQIVGLSMMLYRWDLFGLPIYQLGFVLTVIAAVLTLVSMVDYLRRPGRICGRLAGCLPHGSESPEGFSDRIPPTGSLTWALAPYNLRLCPSGNSSVGRARPCQGRGREFESRFPLHFLRVVIFGSP
jgi:hypothetical protein